MPDKASNRVKGRWISLVNCFATKTLRASSTSPLEPSAERFIKWLHVRARYSAHESYRQIVRRTRGRVSWAEKRSNRPRTCARLRSLHAATNPTFSLKPIRLHVDINGPKMRDPTFVVQERKALKGHPEKERDKEHNDQRPKIGHHSSRRRLGSRWGRSAHIGSVVVVIWPIISQ